MVNIFAEQDGPAGKEIRERRRNVQCARNQIDNTMGERVLKCRAKLNVFVDSTKTKLAKILRHRLGVGVPCCDIQCAAANLSQHSYRASFLRTRTPEARDTSLGHTKNQPQSTDTQAQRDCRAKRPSEGKLQTQSIVFYCRVIPAESRSLLDTSSARGSRIHLKNIKTAGWTLTLAANHVFSSTAIQADCYVVY